MLAKLVNITNFMTDVVTHAQNLILEFVIYIECSLLVSRLLSACCFVVCENKCESEIEREFAYMHTPNIAQSFLIVRGPIFAS